MPRSTAGPLSTFRPSDAQFAHFHVARMHRFVRSPSALTRAAVPTISSLLTLIDYGCMRPPVASTRHPGSGPFTTQQPRYVLRISEQPCAWRLGDRRCNIVRDRRFIQCLD
eukprot:scaffold82500_cov29-Tisochrysis_lutea.AAC.4